VNDANLSNDGRTLDVRVPVHVSKQGGRKVVLTPEGEGPRTNRRRGNDALVRALARAFRWRTLIETGVYSTIAELSAGEKVSPSYVSRLLTLTLLAPALVEHFLDQRQFGPIAMHRFGRPLPLDWEAQRQILSEQT
jgi:hypothetical protein